MWSCAATGWSTESCPRARVPRRSLAPACVPETFQALLRPSWDTWRQTSTCAFSSFSVVGTSCACTTLLRANHFSLWFYLFGLPSSRSTRRARQSRNDTDVKRRFYYHAHNKNFEASPSTTIAHLTRQAKMQLLWIEHSTSRYRTECYITKVTLQSGALPSELKLLDGGCARSYSPMFTPAVLGTSL